MKRIIIVLTLVVTCFTTCSEKKAVKGTRSEFEVIALRTSTPITVDGLLNEPVWQAAQKIPLGNSDTGEEVSDTTFSTYARTCYDDNNLYIMFMCNDEDIYSYFTKRDQHLWEEEAIEVFLDVDNEPNTYVEIELSPRNVLFDSYIIDPVNIDVNATSKFDLSGIKTAVMVHGTVNIRDDVDKNWIAEMAIPFDNIVAGFNTGMLKSAKWKINYYRIDRDADGPIHYAWSPTNGRFHKPSVFGTLVFH